MQKGVQLDVCGENSAKVPKTLEFCIAFDLAMLYGRIYLNAKSQISARLCNKNAQCSHVYNKEALETDGMSNVNIRGLFTMHPHSGVGCGRKNSDVGECTTMWKGALEPVAGKRCFKPARAPDSHWNRICRTQRAHRRTDIWKVDTQAVSEVDLWIYFLSFTLKFSEIFSSELGTSLGPRLPEFETASASAT